MSYSIKHAFGRFRRNEDGTVAFDFCLWFPFFLMLMLMGVEVGLVGIKHVKLERSLDETVRWVRLNTGASPTHQDLKQMICSTNPVKDCLENVHLEMRTMDLRDWQALPAEYECVNRSEPINPMDELSLGMDNQLMVMRVCAKFNPVMPGGFYSTLLTVDNEGYASLRKTTAFVQEPR